MRLALAIFLLLSVLAAVDLNIGKPAKSEGAASTLYRETFDCDCLRRWTIVDLGRHCAPSKWFVQDGALHQTSNIYHTPIDGRFPKREWLGTVALAPGKFKDFAFSFTFWSTDNDGIGCVFRYRDENNYDQFQMDNTFRFWQLTTKRDGRFRVLAWGDEHYQVGKRHRLEIVAMGDIIAARFDGAWLTAVRTPDAQPGRVGFVSRGNAGSHFDDLAIEELDVNKTSKELAPVLLETATKRCRLGRHAHFAGDEVVLVARDDQDLWKLGDLTAEVVAPNGTVLSRSQVSKPGAQVLWKTEGAAGLYRVRLFAGDKVRHEIAFSVWEQPPKAGASAHRGHCKRYPENTLPAFRAAAELGAHQIEFDVWLTKDGHPVVIHDPTVDRTTNGSGKVTQMTFDEVRKLDAGSWKAACFAGVKIPTLRETLDVMPRNICLNVHLKENVELARVVTKQIVEAGREKQCVLACGVAAAKAAKEICPSIRICNMDRQSNANSNYVDYTISLGTDFIQLLDGAPVTRAVTEKLHAAGVTINYFEASDPDKIRTLIDVGVDYILTNDLETCLSVLKEYRVEPLTPEWP